MAILDPRSHGASGMQGQMGGFNTFAPGGGQPAAPPPIPPVGTPQPIPLPPISAPPLPPTGAGGVPFNLDHRPQPPPSPFNPGMGFNTGGAGPVGNHGMGPHVPDGFGPGVWDPPEPEPPGQPPQPDPLTPWAQGQPLPPPPAPVGGGAHPQDMGGFGQGGPGVMPPRTPWAAPKPLDPGIQKYAKPTTGDGAGYRGRGGTFVPMGEGNFFQPGT